MSGKQQGGEIALDGDRQWIIGRASDADIIVLEDSVSRRHAVVTHLSGMITIEDLASTGGLFVNEEKVTSAELKEGDRVLVGTSVLKVVSLGLVPPPPPPPDLPRAPASIALSGSLAEVPLPDLLQLLYGAKRSGILAVQGPGHEAKIFLRQGQVVYSVIDDRHDLGPAKCFNRIIGWAQGTFELRPPDLRTFPVELELPTQALLLDAVRELDELQRLAPRLPPPHQPLEVPLPLAPKLTDLAREELEVLQLVMNWGTLQGALDHTSRDDLAVSGQVLRLVQAGYLRMT